MLAVAGSLATLGGCQGHQPASADATEAGVSETSEADTEACVSAALQNTVFSNKASSELAASFSGQKPEGCPQDFLQQLQATGNAMHAVVQAQDAIKAHNQSKDAAYRAGVVATVNDSTEHPIEDWHKRDAALSEDISVKNGAYEEARATLIAIAGRHGVSKDHPFDASMPDAAAPPATTAAVNGQ